MSNELKPCPFCDGVASVNRYGNSTGGASYTVWCNACSISTAWMNADTEDIAKARAVSAWNRRATSGAASGEVAEGCKSADMGEFACANRAQCFEPCGELGHSADHAKPAEQSAPPVPRMGGITLISDLVKLWDSQSVSEDDYNSEMCRIEDGMREFVATQSASTAPGQAEWCPECHARESDGYEQAIERLLQAVKVYAFNYLQDEAEEVESCTCGPKQHAEAKELFAAIAALSKEKP